MRSTHGLLLLLCLLLGQHHDSHSAAGSGGAPAAALGGGGNRRRLAQLASAAGDAAANPPVVAVDDQRAVDDLGCGPGGACMRRKRVRKRPHRRWPSGQRHPALPKQLMPGGGAALPPPAMPAPAGAADATQQQQPPTTTAATSSEMCGELSAAQLARVAVNTTVMLVVSDWVTTPDLFHHWHGNVRAANISNWLVAAADVPTSAHLVQLGLMERCFRLAGAQQRTGSTGGYHWASADWKAATWRKVGAVRQVLMMGYSVILSDADVMWLRDPLPFVLNHSRADMLISLDAHQSSKAPGDAGLEPGSILGRMMNTGVYFAAARIQVIALFDRWLAANTGRNHDQEGFAALVPSLGPAAPLPNDTRLANLTVGVVLGHLPLSSFMHSYSYSVMRLHEHVNTPVYGVHMVFGYGGQDSKVYKLRDAGLGWDAPGSEYYSPPGGLLSFELQLPPVPPGFGDWDDLSRTEAEMELTHNRAVDLQLQQLYHALGLALALNRTLLMPRMLCFCARGWFPDEACRLPGDTVSQLPFDCTGDQVFNVEALMHPSLPVGGAELHVRPPGFAHDARLPAALRASRALVTPGEPKCQLRHPIWRRRLWWGALPTGRCVEEQHVAASSTGAADGSNAPPQHEQLVVPAGLAAEELRELLSKKHASVGWLHFTNVTAAFRQFSQPDSQAAFEALLPTLTAEWCCRSAQRVKDQGEPNGHVHALRPWGSPQRVCAKRVGDAANDLVHTFFC